ncbi:MAG: tetratricopeptide repeat protein [Flavobacteriales bacterium]|nr:tetratricopeptide repeat protein [Flavobacteriales bacterium]
MISETEEKERHIAEQDQALALAAAEDHRKSLQRNVLIGAAALLALIALLLYRSMRAQATCRKESELHAQRVDELLNQQEIKSINAMMEGQDKERDRVAKDLHDRLGSMLSAIKWQLGELEEDVSEVKSGQVAQYKKVTGMLDDAVGEVRRISHDLVAATLSRFGLAKALEDLRDTVQVNGRLNVELRHHGLDKRLERSMEIMLYRIVQELLSNVLKHANARNVSIDLTRMPGLVSVIVNDDGIGFDPNAVKNGMGLGNVRTRASAFGGSVHIDSRSRAGHHGECGVPGGGVRTVHGRVLCCAPLRMSMNMRSGLLAVMLFTACTAAAQRTDSLWGAWNSARNPDTLRLDALNRLIREVSIDADSAYSLALLQERFAKAGGHDEWRIRALEHQVSALWKRGDLRGATAGHDSILVIMRARGDSAGVATTLRSLAGHFTRAGDFTRASELFHQALRIRDQLGDTLGAARIMTSLGIMCMDHGDPERALAYYTKSLAMHIAVGDSVNTGVILNTICTRYVHWAGAKKRWRTIAER